MANDRLYLVCHHCGQGFMLAKHFGDAWETRNYGELSYQQRLDDFFLEHWRCMAGEAEDPYKFLLLNELQRAVPSIDIETLAATFHGLYQREAKRQGDVRYSDSYAALSEHIKEFDRVLAAYVLEEFIPLAAAQPGELSVLLEMLQATTVGAAIEQLQHHFGKDAKLIDKFIELMRDKNNRRGELNAEPPATRGTYPPLQCSKCGGRTWQTDNGLCEKCSPNMNSAV